MFLCQRINKTKKFKFETGFWFPMLLKKYSDLVEGKKYDAKFLSYALMLHSGKKFRALRYKIKIYSSSSDVRKKM